MSRKRRARRPGSTASPPVAAVSAGTSRSAPPRPRRRLLWVLVGGMLLGTLWAKLGPKFDRPAVESPSATAPQRGSEARLPTPLGPSTSCRTVPTFMHATGLGPSARLSTSERDRVGLVAVEHDAAGRRSRDWQHASWSRYGALASLAIDRHGDVWVIAVPRIHAAQADLDRLRMLYRVDGVSAELAPAFALPVQHAPHSRNPFVALGLGYDCDWDSLFVSLVDGSTPSSERGRLVHLRLHPEPGLIAEYPGVDAIAVSVLRSEGGKWLLYGRARAGRIEALALDGEGRFRGAPVAVADLSGLGPDGNDRARRIDVLEGGGLVVHGTPFQFNLAPPAAGWPTLHYHYAWDSAARAYRFEGYRVFLAP